MGKTEDVEFTQLMAAALRQRRVDLETKYHPCSQCGCSCKLENPQVSDWYVYSARYVWSCWGPSEKACALDPRWHKRGKIVRFEGPGDCWVRVRWEDGEEQVLSPAALAPEDSGAAIHPELEGFVHHDIQRDAS